MAACASPTTQGFWGLLPWSRLPKQFGQPNTESRSQPIHQIQGWIFGLPLDPAQVGPIDFSVRREPVLRHALSDPYPRIIMNPPFSEVRKHIAAALTLLGRGGHEAHAVLVALVPTTFVHPNAETLEILPTDTFATAKVHTKIIRITKPN